MVDRLLGAAKLVKKNFNAGTNRTRDRRISTGSLQLDVALGGGLPVGRNTLFWGEKSGGKSTAAARAVATNQNLCRRCLRPAQNVEAVPPSKQALEMDPNARWSATGQCDCAAQGIVDIPAPMKEPKEKPTAYKDRVLAWRKELKQNSYEEFICAWVDPEDAYDPQWAEQVGVDDRRLYYIRPTTGEEASDIVVVLVESGSVDLLIVDSLAHFTPRQEIKAGAEEWQQGLQARIVNKGVRAWVSMSAKNKNEGRYVTQIWINQLRCVGADTLVMTDQGLQTAGQAIECDALSIADGRGRLSGIGASCRSEQELLRVVDKLGYSVDVGVRHPFRVLSSGKMIWVQAQHLKEGDWVALCREVEWPNGCYGEPLPIVEAKGKEKPISLPDFATVEFCEFLGMWFADGSLFESKGSGVLAFTEQNRDRYRIVYRYLRSLFGERVSTCGEDVLQVWSRQLYRFLRELGCESGGRNKTVPSCIGSRGQWESFLRGMFDSHLREYGFTITVQNESAARKIHIVLRSLGVGGRLYPVGDSWYIDITGSDALVYVRCVGFLEGYKADALLLQDISETSRGKSDIVPHVFEPAIAVIDELRRFGAWSKVDNPRRYARFLAYRRSGGDLNLAWRDLEFLCAIAGACDVQGEHIRVLQDILRERHLWSPVSSVSGVGVAPSVDFDVPGNESFVANGFVTHNTKIGVMFGSPDVKPSGRGQDFAIHAEVKFLSSKVEAIVEQYGSKEEKNVFPIKEKIHYKVTKNRTAATRGIDGYFEQSMRATPSVPAGTVLEDDWIFKQTMKYIVVQHEKAQKGQGRYEIGGIFFKTQVDLKDAITRDSDLAQVVRTAILQELAGAR